MWSMLILTAFKILGISFMQEINHIIDITGCGTRRKVNFNTVRLLWRFHSPDLTRSGK